MLEKGYDPMEFKAKDADGEHVEAGQPRPFFMVFPVFWKERQPAVITYEHFAFLKNRVL